MSIIRLAKHTHDYVILNKLFLEDITISLRLKGFLAFCLSKPNDWHFHVRQLADVLKEGKDALYSIIDEGIEHGYISRETKKGCDGKFIESDYIVREVPIIQKQTSVSDFPDAVKPEKETPTLLSINQTKELLPACLEPGENSENPETIYYQGHGKKTLAITKSEIFKHFAGSKYTPEQINATIKKFRKRKDTIGNPLKILDLMIDEVKVPEQKKAEEEFRPYKPTKLSFPGLND